MEHEETVIESINKLVADTKGVHASLNARLESLEVAHGRPRLDSGRTSPEHKAASRLFTKGILHGDEQSMREYKALSVGSDPDGGYAVTPQMESTIRTVERNISALRFLARGATITSDSLDVLLSNGQPAANWVGETSARPETASPTIAKISIVAHELTASPRATQKFLDDNSSHAEQWLADELATKFSETEGSAFIIGDGVGKPRGLTTYASGTTVDTVEQVNSGANGGVTYSGLVNILQSLKTGYRSGAAWLLSREVIGQILALTGSSTPLWIPSIAVGQPSQLLGYPVFECDFFSAATTGSLSGAFGNFSRGYTIVDRKEITTLRDPYSAKPYVIFDTTKRVGGAVVDGTAIKLLKLSA